MSKLRARTMCPQRWMGRGQSGLPEGMVLTIILVEDGGAVIQHFIILLSHQLALAIVE
jgi:hypothetical protein